MPALQSGRSRLLLLAALLALSSVRCAHKPKTPEQAACLQRVDHCMERCGDDPHTPSADPYDSQIENGCNQTETKCEENCYEDCW